MLSNINLNKRYVLNRPLVWAEMDNNWQNIETAVNYLLAARWQKDFDNVPAGELEVVHNFDLLPQSVTVWQKVDAARWIPIATPDVSYLEGSETRKLYINFTEPVSKIKVMVRF